MTMHCPVCTAPITRQSCRGPEPTYCCTGCSERARWQRRKLVRPRQGAKHVRTAAENHDKNHKRRAAKYGAGYERFSSEDIFERDGWRCHICGKRVHPSRFKRDPEGPSLDHLIPLADGGSHSQANCRLAHLRCNAARGRRGDVQLILLG
jgi:5-methylcytosine-specific restriction endonuclease McrA